MAGSSAERRSDADGLYRRTSALLGAAREDLARADGKCALLLAAVGVVVGALLAAVMGGDWSPNSLDARVAWLWWIGAVASMLAVVALGYGVYPRFQTHYPKKPDRIGYFADAAALTRDELRQALDHAPELDAEWLTDQLHAVSRIVRKKYWAIRVALWLLLSSAVLVCISLLVDLLLR